MKQNRHFLLNTPFKPAPALSTLFIINFILFILLISGFMVLPIIIASGLDFLVTLIIVVGLLAILVVYIVWVRMYYESMWYELREDEMSWRRGVWFHRTGIVPYDRITNLDIIQGPIMRVLGIFTLAVQTAGYSGQAVPEIRIEGIVHAEDLREQIRAFVRSSTNHDGTGTGASGPKTTDQRILDELVAIRTLLAEQKK